MVIGAFPIAKLGSLLIRQISKPIANIVKERAKKSFFFRTYICMPPAQFYNWCEVKSKMWILNLGKPVNVPVLNEAMAIELGANLLGEGIIFSIAVLVLYLEFARQAQKEKNKESARLDEMNTINYTIQELYFQAERQDAQLRELMRCVNELESQVHKSKWPFARKKSPDPGNQEGGGDNSQEGEHSWAPHSHGPFQSPHPSGIIIEAIEYIEKDVIRKSR